MHKLTELIRNDMKPALGVTEPGAIAFAVAAAKERVPGSVTKVKVGLNSGMYKNAFTCGIPNSDQYGNLYAAALGAVAADASLGLESLANITEADNKRAEELVEQGKVEVFLDHMGSYITIDATVFSEEEECTVHIRGSHTNIQWIECNGSVVEGTVEDRLGEEREESEEIPEIHRYSLAEILNYVGNVEIEEIAFIEKAFDMNLELLKEGLASEKTTFGPMLYKENGERFVSDNALKSAQLLCNGAIEARVLGLAKPAMSITGSGAHGIIATMPLYAWAKVDGSLEMKERLLRGTALSYLITMYIKEYSGRLSAFCGCGIAAGTGMACGLAWMRGAGKQEISMVIQNMASGLTGMICDGGNQGCTMKGIVAVDAAFRAVDMALNHVCIEKIHGINGNTPEETMKYMGMIASPGMVKTEEVIVKIMEEK